MGTLYSSGTAWAPQELAAFASQYESVSRNWYVWRPGMTGSGRRSNQRGAHTSWRASISRRRTRCASSSRIYNNL